MAPLPVIPGPGGPVKGGLWNGPQCEHFAQISGYSTELSSREHEKEFLFHFYSFFVGAQMTSRGVGVGKWGLPGSVPAAFLQMALHHWSRQLRSWTGQSQPLVHALSRSLW